jgi:hypothetical protein
VSGAGPPRYRGLGILSVPSGAELSWLERRPVTPEVAGSSPVAPVSHIETNCAISRRFGPTSGSPSRHHGTPQDPLRRKNGDQNGDVFPAFLGADCDALTRFRGTARQLAASLDAGECTPCPLADAFACLLLASAATRVTSADAEGCALAQTPAMSDLACSCLQIRTGSSSSFAISDELGGSCDEDPELASSFAVVRHKCLPLACLLDARQVAQAREWVGWSG